MGATFSIYVKQKIYPQPDVSHRLGNLSSRAFANHYQDIHASVAPTGFYRDPLIESYDHFPLYDLEVNFALLSALSIDNLVAVSDYERIFYTVAQDKNLYRYVEMKNNILASILDKLRLVDKIISPTIDNIKGELRKFQFASTGAGGFVADPTLYAEKVRNAIVKRAESDAEYSSSLTQGIASKVSRVRIAIFTATNLEDEVLRALLPQFGFLPAGRISGPDGYYNVYSMYDRVHVVHVRSGMGTSGLHGSQRVAHDFLSAVEVEMAISVGICFGVDSSSQGLGDVVVAEQFTMYEPAKIKDGAMEFRGDRIPAETRLTSFGHASAADTDRLGHRVFVGAVLTGDKLVDDLVFRNTILKANGKAIGGEMEAGGLVTSCQAKQVRFGLAKGICDFADKKSDDVQEKAASNAVRLVLSFVKDTWGESAAA